MHRQLLLGAFIVACLTAGPVAQVLAGEQPLAQDAEHYVLTGGKGILSRDYCGNIVWSQNGVDKMRFERGASLSFSNNGEWLHVRRAAGGSLMDFGPYDEYVSPGMNLEPDANCGGSGGPLIEGLLARPVGE